MRKYRVLQTAEDEFIVQGRRFGFWWQWYPVSFDDLRSAEQHILYLMRSAEKGRFVKRVVGDSGEYELRYLRQRIEEMEKDK